jgi:hypothetical protein
MRGPLQLNIKWSKKWSETAGTVDEQREAVINNKVNSTTTFLNQGVA